ncbi:hypothetical protein B296_00054638 [Ensete ventricosum]|uniref:RING-type E3 ubiquitin transferase n=1 Tax=Ensete ventricosum TaxID=4639 RepID=A0A426X2N1_ENSVE|nr:hypothetical protein B296_00054638 [Ensete ventricosum]
MPEGSDRSFPLVAVAVDKDKSSQNALKWALDNVAVKGQTIFLVHVITKLSERRGNPSNYHSFIQFLSIQQVKCKDIILEDTDLGKAIVDFVSHAGVEKLIVGASKGGFVRSFRYTDISANICKSVPDFCTVYIISKGKISSMRNAVRSAPVVSSTLRSQILKQTSCVPEPVVSQNSRGTKGSFFFFF